MKVLIIYQLVPEACNLYLEEVSENDWSWMRNTQNKYMNTSLDEETESACLKLSDWLETKTKLDLGEPYKLDQATVLLTGFML